MIEGFEPVYDKNSEILILGSFPSVKSREAGFYYGNKRNRFWTMLSQVFEEKIEDSIESKIAFLKNHKIALWDVVSQSDLNGSADKALEESNKKIANFSFLFPPHTRVRKILCNGKTAYNLFQEVNQTTLDCFCMPSTSPANPRYDFKIWEKALKS